MDAYKNVVRGGGLKLKGGKKKKKKTRGLDAAALVELAPAAPAAPPRPAAARDDGLTETERAHKRRLVARRKEAPRAARKSHRERVDDLNEKLSTMTEHNDIPRISAAGNG